MGTRTGEAALSFSLLPFIYSSGSSHKGKNLHFVVFLNLQTKILSSAFDIQSFQEGGKKSLSHTVTDQVTVHHDSPRFD